MDQGNMVGLAGIVHGQLPVAPPFETFVLDAVGADRTQVLELVVIGAEEGLQIRTARRHAHEDEIADDGDLVLIEGQAGAVGGVELEALAVHRDTDRLARHIVGPAVIGTGQRPVAVRLALDAREAVRADIAKGADLALHVLHDDRMPADAAGQEVVGAFQVFGEAGAHP